MALITDILRGPYGDPQPNVVITMRAKETSARVLVSNSSATTTAADGKYSMQVFPGEYEVLVSTLGKVGEIRVYPDSKDGTLNDFLITPGEEEITPEIVQTVETLRAETAASAQKAATSEKNAKQSEQNATATVSNLKSLGMGTNDIKPISANNDAESLAWMIKDGTFPQFFRNDRGGSNIHPAFGASILSRVGDSYLSITGMYQSPTVVIATGTTAGQGRSATLWTTANTTVDANGFIKKASPIVKLFRDGTCELNDESQGVTTERVSEGIYRISGTLGFNADAQWGGPDGGIEVPLDRNKQPLIWVDYEVEPSGDLLIKTYHRTHLAVPAFARNDILGYDEGMPIDIPEGRWVDLRVEMPAVDEEGTKEEATT